MISGLDNFIGDHRLPVSYGAAAEQWFIPVAKHLAALRQRHGKTIVAGISGTQASGKSTLADLLALLCRNTYQLRAIALSIDDFYLTRQQRELLATSVHPLLATRGVPGTHDISLALDTIRKLSEGRAQTLIPRFDKARDDRCPREKWDRVNTKTDLILLEGWCLGAEPQADSSLVEPVNDLEKIQDPDGAWRRYVNQQLRDIYPELFSMVDTWIMLKAPSFDCVFKWRLEQENKLKSSLLQSELSADCEIDRAIDDRTMDADAIGRFIQHYQRITQHLLKTLPAKADMLFDLDENRKIISGRSPEGFFALAD